MEMIEYLVLLEFKMYLCVYALQNQFGINNYVLNFY